MTVVSVLLSPGVVVSLGRDVVVPGAPDPAAPNAATRGPDPGHRGGAPARAASMFRCAPEIAVSPLLSPVARTQDCPGLWPSAYRPLRSGCGSLLGQPL